MPHLFKLNHHDFRGLAYRALKSPMIESGALRLKVGEPHSDLAWPAGGALINRLNACLGLRQRHLETMLPVGGRVWLK